MGSNSKIEWCDHTFNPWMGCTKVSQGCANCYAEQLMDNRLLSVDGNFDLFVIKERYEQAIKTITSISWREVEVVYMDYQLFP